MEGVLSLTPSLWRAVGYFLDIKGVGTLEAVARQCKEGLNGNFWRRIWVTRCGGRIYKSPRRDYKVDVMVHFAKEVVRRMRTCTSMSRWYDNWEQALQKRRSLLEMEIRHMESSILAYTYHIEENKRKLADISRVDKQAHALVDSVEAYEEDATGPMRTQRRRIEKQLAASNPNPWMHYYNN